MIMTMDTPLVSVITPCYNCSELVGRCIESVQRQKYENWELILIDDGSMDDSLEVCRGYALSDGRIKVYKKENGGVSSARNLGMEKAKGELITFLDSDDSLPPEALLHLVECAKVKGEEIDIVFAGYRLLKNGFESSLPVEKCEMVSAHRLAIELFEPTDYPYQGFICSKLYRRSIIERNGLRFDERIFYNEDRLFTFLYLSYCRQGVYSTHPVYNYYQTGSGAMGSIQGVNYWKFETDFDAFIRMFEGVGRFKSKELVEALQRGTYISYRLNRQLLERYGNNDRRARRRLYRKLKSVLPWSYIVRRKINEEIYFMRVKMHNILDSIRFVLTQLNIRGGVKGNLFRICLCEVELDFCAAA